MSYLATVPTVNLELRENIELRWHPSAPPFASPRHAPAGRLRAGRLQVASCPPVGKSGASAPTRRPASFGEEAKIDLARSTALGLAMWRLERLAFRTGHRQAGGRHCLAPGVLSSFLAVENPARPVRSANISKDVRQLIRTMSRQNPLWVRRASTGNC
jgi:hypothetical protein